MYRHRALTLLLLLLATVLVPALARGQAEPESPALVEPGFPTAEINKLEFPGGDLLEYLKQVKDEAERNRIILNLVINNEAWAQHVRMPPVSLTRVSADTAFKIIEAVADQDQYRVRITPITDRKRTANSVYVLTVDQARRSAPAVVVEKPAPERVLEVFALTEAGESASDESRVRAIISAVDEALGIRSPAEEEKPKVRFHPDSGLLLVYGTKEETDIVGQIIEEVSFTADQKKRFETLQQEYNALMERHQQSKMEQEAREAEKLALKDHTQQLKAEIQHLKAEFVQMQHRNRELEVRAENLQATNAELENRIADMAERLQDRSR